MKIIKWIKFKIAEYKRNKLYKKKLAELKKRDPFTYKNF